MEFKDVVMQTVRDKGVHREKVPEEKIDELIDLIRFAPSALNLQPWRIKVVSDQKTRDALAPALFGQPQAVNCSHLYHSLREHGHGRCDWRKQTNP